MKNRIKPIMPSLREKKRYISYKIVSEKSLNDKLVRTALNSYVIKFLGELLYSRAGIIFLDSKNNAGIIKSSNNYVNEVKAALSLIDNIDYAKVNVFTTTVSGVLNKARTKMEEI